MAHSQTISNLEGWGWPKPENCPESLVLIVSNLNQTRQNIRATMANFPAEHLWRHISASTPSAGNVLLHLAGTERQWIHNKAGGLPIVRDRAREFAADGGMSAQELVSAMDAEAATTDQILSRMTRDAGPASELVQYCFHYTVNHFAYHSGQLVTIRKMFQLDFQVYPHKR